MAFVVPNMHYAQITLANLVKNMIRKTLQVCAAETLLNQMESKWPRGGLRNGGANLFVKLIRQRGGNTIVITKGLKDISLDQRMENYFHEERSR